MNAVGSSGSRLMPAFAALVALLLLATVAPAPLDTALDLLAVGLALGLAWWISRGGADAAPARQTEFAAQLTELARQKDEFLSNVSHELRTPLTSILGYVELLAEPEDGGGDPIRKRWVGAIERNAQRLHETVSDLLMLSQQEAHTLAMRREPVDLAAVVRAAHAGLAEALPAGVVMSCAIDDAVVIGDRGQLHRLVTHLIGNAVKFTPAGAIEVVLATDGQRARLSVRDTGIGIPAADLGRLFVPYARGANAVSNAVQGTGLGLAIIKSIVEKHRGTVAVESELDRGSRFTIVLPAAGSDGALRGGGQQPRFADHGLEPSRD